MNLRTALAQTNLAELNNPLNGSQFQDVKSIFALVINIIIGIGIALTIVYLALGGIQYMTAKGDMKAAQEARNALTNAVIGFIVVLFAITIRIVVANTLGADTNNFGNITPI